MPQPVLAELDQLGVSEDIKIEGEMLAQRIQDAIDIVRASCHPDRRDSKCASRNALPKSLHQKLLECETSGLDEMSERASPASVSTKDPWPSQNANEATSYGKSQTFERGSAIAALPPT